MAVGMPITAGGQILAAAVAAIAPLAVIKQADESVTSSTTLQNDNALVVPLPVADATYLFFCYLQYTGGTQGSSDLKLSWLCPSGATLRYQPLGIGTGGGMGFGTTETAASTPGFGSNGTSNAIGLTMVGSLLVGSATGSLQLEWAQNTSSATPTTVKAQSFLALWRIS